MLEMIESFKNSFDTWGYIILFLYCMGSGYVAIIAAGILASLGHLNLALSIILASFGNFCGSSLIVVLIRYQKKDFAKYLDKHRRKIALMHIWLKKYGSILILVNKYLYGIKFLVPMAIGVSKYNLKKFLILNLIACFVWASSLGLVAFYSSKAIMGIIDEYGQYSYIIVLVVFVMVALLAVLISRIDKSRKNNAKS